MRIDIYTNPSTSTFAAVRSGAALPAEIALRLKNPRLWKTRDLERGRRGLVGADATDVIIAIEGHGRFLLAAA